MTVLPSNTYSTLIEQTRPLALKLHNANQVPSASNEQAESTPLKAKPLPEEEERVIANLIEIWRSQGADQRIINLMTKIQADTTLTADTQEKVKDWSHQFLILNPSDKESLSLAIAFLIIKILRPALELESYEGQILLIDWEDACREALPLFLTNEQIKTFLKQCKKDLFQEDLLKHKCKIADEAFKLLNQTFKRLLLQNDQLIAQAHQILKQKLSSLQESRQQGSDVIVARIHCLIEDIERVAATAMSTTIENSQDLCRELAVAQRTWEGQLEECKREIQKVSYEQ